MALPWVICVGSSFRHRAREGKNATGLPVTLERATVRAQMKVLYWDRTGFCLWAKRLEAGRFLSDWRQVATKEMDWTGLKLLLEGIEAKVVRKRYRHPRSDNAYGIMVT